MSSLHVLVQECVRAIASYASPAAAFPEIQRIVASSTGAISVEVATSKIAIVAEDVALQAFDERRVCIVMREAAMVVAAPIKNASRIFGVLVASYGDETERVMGTHATSELVNAVAQVLGNALALEEKVPQGSSAVLDCDAYEHYVRAHFELYRSFKVPFTLALYDLLQQPPGARDAHAVALRWMVRKSDVVFEVEEGTFIILLTCCPLPCSHVAAGRIEQGTGFAARALTAPRRGESLRRLLARSTLAKPVTETGGILMTDRANLPSQSGDADRTVPTESHRH